MYTAGPEWLSEPGGARVGRARMRDGHHRRGAGMTSGAFSRRTVLKAGLAVAAAAAATGVPVTLGRSGRREAGAALRAPKSLPFPNLPVGKATGAFPSST